VQELGHPELADHTAARVVAFWHEWAARPATDAVSLVAIGEHRLLYAPTRLRHRLESIPFTTGALIEALGDDLVELVGEARLAYGDAGTLRLVPADGVIELPDTDPRVVALRETADPFDWREAAVDEPGAARFGVVDDGALLATANVQLWADTIGRLGVFTAAHARRRGLASKVGSAAAQFSLDVGGIPQWRSRMTNLRSARVAERLGFVVLGRQIYARVRVGGE
jgi:RimJ/RimL family protein N-acetyltransferase